MRPFCRFKRSPENGSTAISVGGGWGALICVRNGADRGWWIRPEKGGGCDSIDNRNKILLEMALCNRTMVSEALDRQGG